MAKMLTVIEERTCERCKGTGKLVSGGACMDCKGTGHVKVEVMG